MAVGLEMLEGKGDRDRRSEKQKITPVEHPEGARFNWAGKVRGKGQKEGVRCQVSENEGKRAGPSAVGGFRLEDGKISSFNLRNL